MVSVSKHQHRQCPSLLKETGRVTDRGYHCPVQGKRMWQNWVTYSAEGFLIYFLSSPSFEHIIYRKRILTNPWYFGWNHSIQHAIHSRGVSPCQPMFSMTVSKKLNKKDKDYILSFTLERIFHGLECVVIMKSKEAESKNPRFLFFQLFVH